MIDDQIVPDGQWRLRKAQSLVKILALRSDHRINRDELIEILWPDGRLSSGVNNFHRTLHSARQTLTGEGRSQDPQLLRLSRGILDLNANGSVTTDVAEFEREAAFATREASIESLKSVISLYAGDLLPDDRYEDWAAARRDRLRDLARDVHLRLARKFAELGEYDSALEIMRRAVDFEPADESVQTELVRMYAQAGMRQESIRQFQHLRAVLRREFDDEPAPESEALYQEILSTGREPSPADGSTPPQLTSIASSPTSQPLFQTNLPVVLTSFVGRERELAEVPTLLTSHRLLTLTGAGGIGKTRIALELGSRLLQSFDDGIWFVQLASITDPMLVEQSIAEILAVREQPPEPLLDTIIDSLRAKDLLIILDNCEHLIQRAAEVTEHLLQYCPSVRMLATSREPLRVPGEQVFHVPPLIQPTGRGDQPDSLLENEAIRLFIERAQLIQAGFTATENDASALTRICHRLDGMPLAIELAAARVSILSPGQIAERLDDALPLLTDSHRTAPSRQQTMEAAIDWTYDRLSPDEQWLFRQLSVFVGGISVEAVTAIADPDRLPARTSSLDLLKQLADRSLITIEESGAGLRYRIPEPLRQYGIQQLGRHDEYLIAHTRHCTWCVQLAEDGAHALNQAIRQEVMEEVDHELGNLRAALGWSVTEASDVTYGLRLGAALWQYWQVRGLAYEGRTWLDRALARSSDRSKGLRARALHASGNLARNHGDFGDAIEYHQESLSLQRQLDDPHGTAYALNNLGAVHRDLGEYERTIELCTESLRLFQTVGDTRSAGISLINLGMASRQLGDLVPASNFYRQSLRTFRKLGDDRHVAAVLNYLAQIAVQESEFGRAHAYVTESLELNRAVGDAWGEALALMTLGGVVEADDDYEHALQLYRGSLEILDQLGVNHHIAQCLTRLAGAVRQLGHPEAAIKLLGAAQAIRETVGIDVLSSDKPEYDRLLHDLKHHVGEQKFDTVWATGWAMTLDRAVAFALSSFPEV